MEVRRFGLANATRDMWTWGRRPQTPGVYRLDSTRLFLKKDRAPHETRPPAVTLADGGFPTEKAARSYPTHFGEGPRPDCLTSDASTVTMHSNTRRSTNE